MSFFVINSSAMDVKMLRCVQITIYLSCWMLDVPGMRVGTDRGCGWLHSLPLLLWLL